MSVEAEGFVLREVAPGVSVDRIRALTGAPVRLSSDLREMSFD
jgi:acyl CoA:acetate/3-ketoacid CoA transferase beta subunit